MIFQRVGERVRAAIAGHRCIGEAAIGGDVNAAVRRGCVGQYCEGAAAIVLQYSRAERDNQWGIERRAVAVVGRFGRD